MKTKATKLPAFCVYASTLEDATGRDYAPGDGITAPSSRLYAVADTRDEAEGIRSRLLYGRLLTRPRMPGDGTLYPVLEVGEFDPLDFVGSQNRDEYTGKRYAALCGRLYEQAKKWAEELAK